MVYDIPYIILYPMPTPMHFLCLLLHVEFEPTDHQEDAPHGPDHRRFLL